jgi:hypothetical protein
MRKVLLVAGVLAASAALHAATIIGTTTSANSFPFTNFAGTRYQQVYAASNFLSGPITINGLTFYDSRYPNSMLSSKTFTFHLSTTQTAVGALSSNMGLNVGSDDALFAVFAGGGAVTGSFTVSGTPFTYTPSAGNLLMDIFVSGGSGAVSGGSGFIDAMYEDSGTIFSRMMDSGSSYAYGLVTGFETGEVSPNSAVPEPGTMGLLALGLGVAAWRRSRL